MGQLEPLAQRYRDEAKSSGDDPKYLFFLAKNSEGPVPRVRELCKLGVAASLSQASVATKGEQSPVGLVRSISNELAPPMAQMVLLDIPDSGGFYVAEIVEVTTDAVASFIADFEAKKLERKQLG